MDDLKATYNNLYKAIEQMAEGEVYDEPLMGTLKIGFEKFQKDFKSGDFTLSKKDPRSIQDAIAEYLGIVSDTLISDASLGKSSAECSNKLANVYVQMGEHRLLFVDIKKKTFIIFVD